MAELRYLAPGTLEEAIGAFAAAKLPSFRTAACGHTRRAFQVSRGDFFRVEIAVPDALDCGRQDRLIPPAHSEFYAKKILGAKLEILEQCGHMLPYEKTEDFVRLTTAFCK